MEDVFLYLAIVLSVIILLPFYRVLKGPTIFDRLLGASAIGTKTLVLVCLIGFLYGRIELFVDIALAYAVLNFIGLVAVARYFQSHPEER